MVEERCILGNKTVDDPQIQKVYPIMQRDPKFQDSPRKAATNPGEWSSPAQCSNCSRPRALIQLMYRD